MVPVKPLALRTPATTKNKKVTGKPGKKMLSKTMKPSYSKVQKSIKKTMGY